MRVTKSGAVRAVAVTAALYGVVIFGRLALHDWDASFFITAGRVFCEPAETPTRLFMGAPRGYDGQFYYRLALHPFTRTRREDGITIDFPPYRQQRILYPLMVHVLAFGNARWVPWSLIAVSYLAVCGLAFSAARLAERFAMPPLYGLLIACYPGVLLALVRDLPDTLAISLMVLALYFLHSRRMTLAACMLALAVLSRETVILLAAALFAHSIWRAMRRQSAWPETVQLLIPLVAFAGWQWWIFARWGMFGAAGGKANWGGLAFAAVVLLIRAVHLALRLRPLQLAELLYLGAMILLAAKVFLPSTVSPGVKLAWPGYLILAAFLSGSVWVEDWAFFRGCEELMVLGFIMLMGSRDRRLVKMAMASTLAIWMALAARTVIMQ